MTFFGPFFGPEIREIRRKPSKKWSRKWVIFCPKLGKIGVNPVQKSSKNRHFSTLFTGFDRFVLPGVDFLTGGCTQKSVENRTFSTIFEVQDRSLLPGVDFSGPPVPHQDPENAHPGMPSGPEIPSLNDLQTISCRRP